VPNTRAEAVIAIESYRDGCEDRVAVIDAGDRLVVVVVVVAVVVVVVVVADGAGGIGRGDLAAETVVREVQLAYRDLHSGMEWSAMLNRLDLGISAGETTAVVVDIRPYGIAGASVGDSQAWIFDDGSIADLTSNQSRKPLLGSGRAEPVSFSHNPLAGIMLVATDGFYDYAKRTEINRLVFQTDFYSVPRKCIEMVQLPSGEFWDDIGVVAVRTRPQRRSRQSYSI
jgi:serine/threonine protein phosphatase PrpC